jgi:RNA-directed DNA polymerase
LLLNYYKAMADSIWNSYRKRFKETALANGYTQEAISKYLKYAKHLHQQKLPIIYDQEHLSLLVGYKVQYLRNISNAQHFFYRAFQIPKKSGGKRTIEEPLPSLKEIQRWILDNILSKVTVSKYAKAFHKKRSIRSNAAYHQNKNCVLRIDVTDFFGSIKYEKVYKTFIALGYTEAVSTMLANLCTKDNKLPQGAPTSPALSNIIFLLADKRISAFAWKKGIHYTRYADDMTFSGDFEPGMVIKFVKSVLKDNDLQVNDKKTRVQKRHQRQIVTGITVNQKMKAPREMRRSLRQSVYYIEKYGLPSHLAKTENSRANHIRHLVGIANFILFIDPNDQEAKRYYELLLEYLK